MGGNILWALAIESRPSSFPSRGGPGQGGSGGGLDLIAESNRPPIPLVGLGATADHVTALNPRSGVIPAYPPGKGKGSAWDESCPTAVGARSRRLNNRLGECFPKMGGMK